MLANSTRILVVGSGSIARRHIGNLHELFPHASIGLLRHSSHDFPAELKGLVERVFVSLHEAIEWQPSVAIICNPSTKHLAVALPLANQSIHLLIEKPVSHSAERVSELVSTARQQKNIVMVAYNFRFSVSMQILKDALDGGSIGKMLHIRAEAGQYLPDWRPSAPYQDTVSARKELGGGVLLELSHEIDYVRWLAGEFNAVTARVDKLSNLAMDVEDSADLLCSFSPGATGHIHIDMIQRKPSRFCKIIGSEGTLTWNGITGEVLLHLPGRMDAEVLHPAGVEPRNDMYRKELRHFFACCQGRATPQASGEDALRVLQVIDATRLSSSTGKRVAL